MTFESDFLLKVFQIAWIDIVLSGDNAVVIAMAAHRLPKHRRRVAVVCGAGGAIALRVLFTAVMALLLVLPLLRFAGGVVLVWIAIKLLRQEKAESESHHVRVAGSLMQAVSTIIVADAVMSLDNMLAVGGASEGNIPLLMFGLLLSIGIIMTCSAIIAKWMNRFPFLIVVGACVLAWVAGKMMIKDRQVAELITTRLGTCYFADWDEEFAKRLEPLTRHLLLQPHWISWTVALPLVVVSHSAPHLVHQHWVGWAVVAAVVLFVVSSPRWLALFARLRASPAPDPEALAPPIVALDDPEASPAASSQILPEDP